MKAIRAFRHRPNRRGMIAAWSKIQRTVYSPRILQELPKFAEHAAKTFWDAEPLQAIRALREGDVVFFIAFQIRLDQIDCAMLAIDRTIADRAPLIRCRYMLEGFRQAAEERLVKLGGTWPPYDALSGAGEPSESRD